MKTEYNVHIPSSVSAHKKQVEEFEKPFLAVAVNPIVLLMCEKGKPEDTIQLFKGNKEDLDFQNIEGRVQAWALSVIQPQLPKGNIRMALRFAKGFDFTMTWLDSNG